MAETTLLRTLQHDVHQVGLELRRSGVRPGLRRTFGDLESFYLSTERRQRLAGMGRVRRLFNFSLWLVRSLFLRLTPIRRLLLILGLLFVASMQFSIAGTRIQINVPGMGVALVLLVLMLELKDKLLARDELEAGRAVQQALHPPASPALAGWDVSLFTRSANDVGGDLVDWQTLGTGRVGIALGDVAGKGLSAALLMTKLQATVRALAPDCTDAGALVARVNRILHRDGLPNRFSTLVYLELRALDTRVPLVVAGHMPPLVIRRGCGIEELPRGGPALGLLDAGSYHAIDVDLAPGDALVVYTDGVTEAMDRSTDQFGEERLRALLRGAGDRPAAEIVSAIVGAVDEFAGDAPAHDDLSLVVVRPLPTPWPAQRAAAPP